MLTILLRWVLEEWVSWPQNRHPYGRAEYLKITISWIFIPRTTVHILYKTCYHWNCTAVLALSRYVLKHTASYILMVKMKYPNPSSNPFPHVSSQSRTKYTDKQRNNDSDFSELLQTDSRGMGCVLRRMHSEAPFPLERERKAWNREVI